ncbi:MAG: hypothetical protein WD020_03050 [Acidimicrobiia bacterium]
MPKRNAVFSVRCQTHNRNEMLSTGSIVAVHSIASGRLAYYRCACGRIGWFVEGDSVHPDARKGHCA